MSKNIQIGEDFFENIEGDVIISSEDTVSITTSKWKDEKKRPQKKGKRIIKHVGRDYIRIDGKGTTVITGDSK